MNKYMSGNFLFISYDLYISMEMHYFLKNNVAYVTMKKAIEI